MDDGWAESYPTTNGGQLYHCSTSRFHHHHHSGRSRHHSPRSEHEHDSGTDENDHLPPDGATAIHVGDEPHGMHHRHHLPPDGIPEDHSMHRPEDDFPHHRPRTSSPSPPPPYSPVPRNGNDHGQPGMYRQQQPKFNSPYRRAAHTSSPIAMARKAQHPHSGGHGLPPMPYPHYHGAPHRRRRWSIMLFLRLAAGSCALAYLAVVIRSKMLLDRWAGNRAGGRGAAPPGSTSSERRNGKYEGGAGDNVLEVTSEAAEWARKWRANERRTVADNAMRRAEKRRNWTRPPLPLVNGNGEARHMTRYDFSLLDEGRAGTPPHSAISVSDAPPLPDADDAAGDNPLLVLASLEQLCGSEARNASLHNPGSYLARDALNSKSRVLITGILNPIGFHLALALQERCGVKTVMGIDPMFPNSVLHRLELQQRIAILTKAIPSLSQPIMIPYVGLDPRLNPKKAADAAGSGTAGSLMLPGSGELNFLTFRPTHIVHLASALPDVYRDEEGRREGKRNDISPYCGSAEEDRVPPLFEIRQATAGMEHLLSSVGSAPASLSEDGKSVRPHLTYASHGDIYTNAGKGRRLKGKGMETFHPNTKLIDEVLAGTYHSLRGVYTVGLRLSDVYGPWGMRGTRMYNLTEEAVRRWRLFSGDEEDVAEVEVVGDDDNIGNGNGIGSSSSARQLRDALNVAEEVGRAEGDFLFVDDAVDAIIAAMQYRKESSSPVVFDVAAGERTSLYDAADMMEDLMPTSSIKKGKIESESTAERSTVISLAGEQLHWSPRTSFRDGLIKTLAWHLDRNLPYGPTQPSSARKDFRRSPADEETGDAFLVRQGLQPCATNDTACLRGGRRLPCASECATSSDPSICTSSLFDSIIAVSRDLTEGCDVVLYTSSLGYDVEDITLHAEYEEPAEGEQEVCNVAFVPSDSTLVKKAISKVPASSLKSVGIKEDWGNMDTEKRLEALNGRILHRGWVLIWVPDAVGELPPELAYLPKLSPGKLFASSARHVMFVDEKFSVTPNTDDVLFLSHEMHRDALRDRTFVRKDESGKKHKYFLPAEPERRSVLLANTMKQRKSKDEKAAVGPVPIPKKISVYEAAKHMVFEIGGDPNESDPKPLKQQREFYERVPTFVNRDDLRSIYEPAHRYEMHHWIRTRWLVHDLTAEEGRQLRCEWYGEHIHWGNNLDQLSFAHVMAKRELERKFARDEPDDHMRAAMPKHPEIEGMSDSHEWHPVLGMNEGWGRKGSTLVRPLEKVPEHMFDPEDEEEGEKEVVEEEAHIRGNRKSDVEMFVRIMSDKVMLMSRKVWGDKMKRKISQTKDAGEK